MSWWRVSSPPVSGGVAMSSQRRARTVQPPPRPALLTRARVTPLLFILLLSLLAGWGVTLLLDPLNMPVRVVSVDGEIKYLDREGLEQTVAQAVSGNFFSVDLVRIRDKIERLPWVKSASVRRVWPDTLAVRVTEQLPLAYWGTDALVNHQGEVFKPQRLPRLPGLVTLAGEEAQAKRITKGYLSMRSLLETAGLALKRLRVDARHSWQIETEGGLLLDLGRRDVMPRLSRFVQLYPFLKDRADASLERVDLRYTNGFSVYWQAKTEQQSQMDSPSSGARIAGK
ncbi:MAG: cell division protein FtsQ [gamma proteobacterium symbiont of Ctena orbiculata]|nr:MAG: cell division protein FtsQ [gamma proteobacterium symbiont of Ctena orbiculata]PUB77801.1 MAG: cell division protein FtsQ [gamma proteobacterium symbiont of Ctena orbiculata]